ncbi:MAG: pyruvate dehydrogenase (acetyl-transferring) E1 component subunit alpha [Rhodothermales bacterium]
MASETQNKKKPKKPEKAAGNGAEQAVEEKGRANGQPVELPATLGLDVSFQTYQADSYTHEDLGFSEDQVRAMYRNMLLQRRFEERAAQMYGKQKIAGFLHLYIGQEAVSTGAINAIEVGKDSVITAYRDHGLGLALGMTPNECMAELFGKKTGSSKGKGGSMHYFKKEVNMYGGHGIVGAHIAVGVGIAFAHKYKQDGGVCLTFFGDGAVGQGSFHEAANLASLYQVPVILIVENNQYAMGTATHRAFAQPEFHRYAVSYGMPSSLANGMDVFSVYKAMSDHVKMARENKPSILEVRTYRYRGHSMSDPANYRTKEELDEKRNEDPIIRLKSYILEHEMSTNEELDQVDDEVKQIVIESVEFSENSESPEIDSIYEDVYAQSDYPFLTNGNGEGNGDSK